MSITAAMLPRLVSIVCAVLLAALLIFVFFVPKPTTQGLAARQRQKEVALVGETKEVTDRKTIAEAYISNKIWSGDAQAVAPAALAIVNQLVSDQKLKLVRFQPQRTAVVGELTQLPFVLTVEGAYLKALELTKALEANERLAVTLVQVSSSDPSSDAATVTIGLTAYLKSASKEATSDVKA
jgi:predicted acyltransferase